MDPHCHCHQAAGIRRLSDPYLEHVALAMDLRRLRLPVALVNRIIDRIRSTTVIPGPSIPQKKASLPGCTVARLGRRSRLTVDRGMESPAQREYLPMPTGCNS